MSKSSARSAIRLRGVRHNNLKNFDLDLPLNRLIVITGLSGSGKSSLAFDTLFAEGQRRYIETFSPYARQFFDRMDKPQVDSIEGIPPAIAIEQRNAVKTTRSTVGTMTEIADYMKLVWPTIAQLHCRQCGRLVRKDSPQQVWQWANDEFRMTNGDSSAADILITFDVPLAEKISLEESLALVSKQGYQRLLVGHEIVRLEEAAARIGHSSSVIRHLTVVQDRVKLATANRARFVEACEQAYHFGKGKLTLHVTDPKHATRPPYHFSNRFHCAECDIEYREPTPALFSFNHPVGACPACKGFGRIISIDYDLAIPDRSKTLAEGVVRPWQTGHGLESQNDLMRACRQLEVPTDVPFEKLSKKWQEFVINGEPGYGTDEEHEWPRAWYGVKGYFRWLESKAYKMHVRVLLSRYRAYTTCPDCNGARFQPETLLYLLNVGSRSNRDLSPSSGEKLETGKMPVLLTLADFYQLPIRDALALIDHFVELKKFRPNDPVGLVFNEVRSRLGFLNDVGLSYLTLDRATRSLSGGETERVSLTTCLGTRLVNTLFVLDEPSVGLHPRDTERLVRILEQLRNAGNTVVVVEHEASVMRAADQIIDLGPGHGATGGEVVFQGTYKDILRAKDSLTGQYLSGRKEIEIPERRPVRQASRPSSYSKKTNVEMHGFALNERSENNGDRSRLDRDPTLKLAHATRHNLKDVSVEIPLGRFVCVTGVSGSGKTTLIREVILPALEAKLRTQLANLKFAAKASERIEDEKENEDEGEGKPETQNSKFEIELAGFENLRRVVLVDQSILGKTPRSNPAVYIGAFDDIREVFAQSEVAKQRGLNASAFSFNSAQGQCERCRGAGFEKIEMQFLSDVFIRCPECDGRRYRPHILEVKIQGADAEWSIGDMLEATVDEAIQFLCGFPESRPAVRAAESLKLLQEVGLGYLRLGQPINTLSGGESQRLKLVKHLAEATQRAADVRSATRGKTETEHGRDAHGTLFLFDEPTTGLHFDDVRVLLKVFQRLVDAGHSVLVIEHNLDVIKSADWVIDLGPGAGDEGGKIVAQGTPEEVAACDTSPTGKFLKDLLNPRPAASRFPDKNGNGHETRYPKLTGVAR
ncbi:MAG TPA: excinuclease ABC subunit UvrA [Verrucomicrobiae bacterium]|jgi:excinuclease ABC subunit A|nr:excinuclease ABC subunit UvrA [Verrucomicrobiae bacterium]